MKIYSEQDFLVFTTEQKLGAAKSKIRKQFYTNSMTNMSDYFLSKPILNFEDFTFTIRRFNL